MDPRGFIDELTPEDFAALPAEVQRKVLAIGERVAQEVVSYAVKIFIGRSLAVDPAARFNHASGVMLSWGRDTCLVTADHVISAWQERHKEDGELIFQVGNTRFDPVDRCLWRDPERDIAVLSVSAVDRQRVEPSRAYEAEPDWPPQLPKHDFWLTLVGYPVQLRSRKGRGLVDLQPLGGIMRVTSRGVGNLKCTFERDVLIPVYGGFIPPRETEFGGMSGGPAFYMEGEEPRLAGIITDNSSNLDTFWIARLDGVPAEVWADVRSNGG